MTELRVLSEFRESEARDTLGTGHTFWSYVDSHTSAYPRRTSNCGDDCYNGLGNDECVIYAHNRGERQCIAANHRYERCSKWVVDGSPFCQRHLRRAWEALWVQAIDSEQTLLKRELEKVHEERMSLASRIAGNLGIEGALVLDAAIAARNQRERVYFFAAGYAVKIGRSVHPEKRIRTLKGTLAPEDVDVSAGELIGTIPGGCHVESQMQGRFRRHHLIGEWFRLAPIRDEIGEIVAEFADLEGGAA